MPLRRLAPYRCDMHFADTKIRLGVAVLLAGFGLTTTSASAAQARLVHCSEGTCLRVSGHRPTVAVAVRVRGDVLPVEGKRAWRVTVPLATARDWASPSGQSLTLDFVDVRTGLARSQEVSLPPGALGRHVELASLVISAR